MSERLTDEKLLEIEEQHDTVFAFKHLPALLAEIKALKHERDEARKTAAMEALQLAAESMRTRWELSHGRPDTDGARCDRIRANEASLLQDRIIRHFQLPPTSRIEVDEDKRPAPPNLLENAS